MGKEKRKTRGKKGGGRGEERRGREEEETGREYRIKNRKWGEGNGEERGPELEAKQMKIYENYPENNRNRH